MDLNWFPGHMMKALREMESKLKLIDLIIEVVDARIVFSSSNPILKRLAGTKQRLLLLNKCDLADPKVSSLWMAWLTEHNQHFLLIDAKRDNLRKIVLDKVAVMMQARYDRDLSRGIRHPQYKLMVVGIPNVGKSTVINALINRSATKVGNQPGVTKGQQWLKVNAMFDLLDTPGVLWPKMNRNVVAYKLALVNGIAQHVLPMEELTDYALNWLDRFYPNYLVNFYGIAKKNDTDRANNVIWDGQVCSDLFAHIGVDVFKLNQNEMEKAIKEARRMFLNNLWSASLQRLSFETPSEVASYE